MLFSEIYGCYFNAVAEILKEAVNETLTGRKMTEIIYRKAFGESFMVIEDALKKEEWPLVTADMRTPLRHIPSQPLTIIQKRWMKSLLMDPRIHLFTPDAAGLEDVKPLYKPEMFVYYDRYQDGDPCGDENYVRNFRTVLDALKTGQGLLVKFYGRTGLEHEIHGVPKRLEYSLKDDKFRIRFIPTEGRFRDVMEINMSRITDCRIVEINSEFHEKPAAMPRETVILELLDERNALSRAMIHFSYLEKETRQLDENHYRITIHYDRNDETELMILILSFGPLLHVVEPENFREKIKKRIDKQMEEI